MKRRGFDMEKNIIEKIVQIKDVLPKKQRLLCNYLAIHYVEAGIMTVAELAAQSGVGTTTVMRLMKTLGYENYSDFKRDLLNLSLMRNASSYHGVKQGFKSATQGADSNILSSLWAETTHTIENIITPKNIQQIGKAVELMLSASCIYFLGLRSSRAAAYYLESTISRFYPKTKQLSSEPDFLFDRALRMEADNVLLIFSVWPCTKTTIDIADLVHQRGIPVILITNTMLNPIARYAQVVIDTNSVSSGCGSLPIFFIAEALIAEMGRQTEPDSTETLETLEHQLEPLGVFIRERSL